MECVAVAILAAQGIRACTNAHEQGFVAGRHLGNGQGRSRVDFAHQHLNLIALDHALSLVWKRSAGSPSPQ